MQESRLTPRLAAIACLAVALVFSPQAAEAGVIFSGSGTNPEASATASGKAEFTISGNTLTVVLTNTTSPRTAAQGNAMTGVTFDINPGSPALTLTSIALTSGARIWTSEAASNTSDALAGSWTTVLGSSPLGEYGVATSGFGGRFNGGSITRGNSGANYGIVSAGTFDGTDVVFGGSQFPLIQDSLTFTFTGASGILESQLGNVKLLFGTDGTGVISTTTTTTTTGIASTPEPSSVVLGLTALLGAGGFARWRRRGSK